MRGAAAGSKGSSSRGLVNLDLTKQEGAHSRVLQELGYERPDVGGYGHVPASVRSSVKDRASQFSHASSVRKDGGDPHGGGSPVMTFVRQSLALQLVLDTWTGQILCASEGARKALGKSQAEVTGFSIYDLVDGLGLVEWAKAVGALASGAQGKKVALRCVPFKTPVRHITSCL